MNASDKESFIKAVYEIVRLIPEGRVTTYGAIAKAIGYPNMSRLVGRIMSDSQNLDIPAHRVVNSQGKLSTAHISTMMFLLEKEKIEVKNNKIVDFKSIFWNPINEISLP